MFPRQFKSLIPAVIFLVSLYMAACDRNQAGHVETFSGLTMGTSYSIKFIPPKNVNLTAIKQDVENRLQNINASMSTYLEDSELSLINKTGANVWVPVSNDLFKVLETARNISIKSEGAFDITVGPLVNLWGFGPEKRPIVTPDERVIKKLLNNTGINKIKLDKNNKAIKKAHDSVYIDLSAIAKGFAVDSIASLLHEKYGLNSYLVEIGGEVSASGYNQGGERWRVGIERPEPERREIQRIIRLEEIAMATSGGYRNYFDLEGKRYSHTINPATGQPVTHNLESVTVLHKSAMIADAWATAMLVMGVEQAKIKAEEYQLAVLMVAKLDNERHLEIMNNHFRKYLLPSE